MSNGIIVLTGNIAAGKTTLGQLLATRLNGHFEPESVDDNPYLTDFYRDMSSWSLHLLCHFLGHRVRQFETAHASTKTVILDRSPFDDANIFAPALHRMGCFSSRDYSTYLQISRQIITKLRPPTVLVYLRAPTAVLLQRIEAR